MTGSSLFNVYGDKTNKLIQGATLHSLLLNKTPMKSFRELNAYTL